MYYSTKTNLRRILKAKVTQATFSDHNAINLDANNMLAKEPAKNITTGEFVDTISISFLDKEEIKERRMNTLEMKDMESLFVSKPMGCRQNPHRGKRHYLYLENRKNKISELN